MHVGERIVISEHEFSKMVGDALKDVPAPDFIVGPGRSGAIAAVYASYRMHRPFVPFGHPGGPKGTNVLIVDTVSMSGRTIRRAIAKYEKMGYVVNAITIVPQNQRRHHFWYENPNDDQARQEKTRCPFP